MCRTSFGGHGLRSKSSAAPEARAWACAGVIRTAFMANEITERPELNGQAGRGASGNGSSQHTNGKVPSYYQVLGVDQSIDPDGLAQTYTRLRERHHPERNASDPLAREIVRYLDRAYATLIDPERRRAYDASLGNGHRSDGDSPSIGVVTHSNDSHNGHAPSTAGVPVSAQNGAAVLVAAPPSA